MSRLSSRIKTKAISKKILEDPSTNRAFLRLAALLMEIIQANNPVDPLLSDDNTHEHVPKKQAIEILRKGGKINDNVKGCPGSFEAT